MTCKKILGFVLAICLFHLNGYAAQQVFDVRQFGAKGDGKTLDTEAIQKALDACGKAGGGTVQLTTGVYLSKPIFLKTNTTLQIDEGATLKATDEPADFINPRKTDLNGFVNASKQTNVAITGKGTINGSGQRWWPAALEAKAAKKPETQKRPRMVIFTGCKDVRVEGVTLTNSPSFHLVPKDCENVDIAGVKFLDPNNPPNTDAMDPSTSRHVRITRCIVDVGDDHVAIKSGRANPEYPNAACEDITVTDCTFLQGHGMSIGSEITGGVKNLKVERLTFENSDNGIRIKTDRTKGGMVENASYTDITMKNVIVPISIAGYYPKLPDEDKAQPVTPTTPVYRNILIKNMTATSPESAGFIVGVPESPITDVVLENVTITAPKGLIIRNAKVTLKNVKIIVQEGEPFILQENAAVVGLEPAKK
jgi:polygalacturonase